MSVALRLLLILGLAAIGIFFVQSLPRDVVLVYALDAPAAIRSVEVEVRREGVPVRHAEWRLPDGAPAQLRHPVRLPDGTYEVSVRVARDAGAARTARLPLVVVESGPVVLAVHDREPRAD